MSLNLDSNLYLQNKKLEKKILKKFKKNFLKKLSKIFLVGENICVGNPLIGWVQY